MESLPPGFVHDAGAILVHRETGQIALVRTKKNRWGFPKGKIDPGESVEDAMRREVYEETGVTDLHIEKKLPMYARPRISRPDIHIMMHMYLVTTAEHILAPVASDVYECTWFPREHIQEQLTLEVDKQYYRSLLKNKYIS